MLKSHTFLTVKLDVISIGSVGTLMYSSWTSTQFRQELYGGGIFSKVKNENQDFLACCKKQYTKKNRTLVSFTAHQVHPTIGGKCDNSADLKIQEKDKNHSLINPAKGNPVRIFQSPDLRTALMLVLNRSG